MGKAESGRRELAAPRPLVMGMTIGALLGFMAADLDLLTVISYRGSDATIILLSTAAGALLSKLGAGRLLGAATILVALLWSAVTFTPLTHWLTSGLPRDDALREADAVFVLASGIQSDGELTTAAMSRLLHGLQLLGRGYASRLVLAELPPPFASYRDAACELMDDLGLQQEVIAVGPTFSTHEEAVAVGELFEEQGWERIIVVTSPTHSRRASAAFEQEGITVISSPSVETSFDLSSLHLWGSGDHRKNAFAALLHEYAGLLYYRLRGWL